jgi:hypothetical protein
MFGRTRVATPAGSDATGTHHANGSVLDHDLAGFARSGEGSAKA